MTYPFIIPGLCSNNDVTFQITIRHLDPGITQFKIQAVRRSRYSQSAVYRGEFTEPWSVLLPSRNSGTDTVTGARSVMNCHHLGYFGHWDIFCHNDDIKFKLIWRRFVPEKNVFD